MIVAANQMRYNTIDVVLAMKVGCFPRLGDLKTHH